MTMSRSGTDRRTMSDGSNRREMPSASKPSNAWWCRNRKTSSVKKQAVCQIRLVLAINWEQKVQESLDDHNWASSACRNSAWSCNLLYFSDVSVSVFRKWDNPVQKFVHSKCFFQSFIVGLPCICLPITVSFSILLLKVWHFTFYKVPLKQLKLFFCD